MVRPYRKKDYWPLIHGPRFRGSRVTDNLRELAVGRTIVFRHRPNDLSPEFVRSYWYKVAAKIKNNGDYEVYEGLPDGHPLRKIAAEVGWLMSQGSASNRKVTSSGAFLYYIISINDFTYWDRLPDYTFDHMGMWVVPEKYVKHNKTD